HPPSPKLRQGLDFATLLVDLDIPKVTRIRAEQLVASFPAAELLRDAPEHQLITAGLPADTARALAEWLDDSDHARLLVESAAALARLDALAPAQAQVPAGPLDGQTVV